jgi:hypothetical protein
MCRLIRRGAPGSDRRLTALGAPGDRLIGMSATSSHRQIRRWRRVILGWSDAAQSTHDGGRGAPINLVWPNRAVTP